MKNLKHLDHFKINDLDCIIEKYKITKYGTPDLSLPTETLIYIKESTTGYCFIKVGILYGTPLERLYEVLDIQLNRIKYINYDAIVREIEKERNKQNA